METKNVLVVLAGALVLSLIVSLAVLGNFKGTGYAVGDTVKTPAIYEGTSKSFTLGGVSYTLYVSDISIQDFAGGTKLADFNLENKQTLTVKEGESAVVKLQEYAGGKSLEVKLLYIRSNIFKKNYAVFQVTEVEPVEVQPVPSGEVIPGREVFSGTCNWRNFLINDKNKTIDQIGIELTNENFQKKGFSVIINEVDFSVNCGFPRPSGGMLFDTFSGFQINQKIGLHSLDGNRIIDLNGVCQQMTDQDYASCVDSHIVVNYELRV